MKIPFTDYREHAKKGATENTRINLVASSNEKGAHYFTNYYNQSAKPWFYNKNLTREIVSTINRCRANHYNLNDSLARIGIIEKKNCECSYENQNLDHILWQCYKFDTERERFLQKLKKINLQLPLSSCVLLYQPTVKICKILQEFLKNCNLRI